jgi:hypothetical protein
MKDCVKARDREGYGVVRNALGPPRAVLPNGRGFTELPLFLRHVK